MCALHCCPERKDAIINPESPSQLVCLNINSNHRAVLRRIFGLDREILNERSSANGYRNDVSVTALHLKLLQE